MEPDRFSRSEINDSNDGTRTLNSEDIQLHKIRLRFLHGYK